MKQNKDTIEDAEIAIHVISWLGIITATTVVGLALRHLL